MVKKQSTLSSLASLYHRTGDTSSMVATYSTLLATYPPGDQDLVELWPTITDSLLGLIKLSQPAWDMVCAVEPPY